MEPSPFVVLLKPSSVGLELSPSVSVRAVAVGRCCSYRRWVVLELSALGGLGAVAVGLVLELSPLGGVGAVAVGSVLELSPSVWWWSFRRRSVLELSASGGAGAVAVGSV